MRKTLLAAVAALAMTPVPAAADAPVAACRFDEMQEISTGSNYSVTGYGFVLHPGTEEVSIVCSIEIDGFVAAETRPGTGTAFAAVAQDLAFNAAGDEVVLGCTTATVAGHPAHRSCERVGRPGEALNPVFDALNEFPMEFVDAIACDALADAAGSYGPVTIDGQGDIYVAGEWFWDCAPYGT